jgi:hypothetical protein
MKTSLRIRAFTNKAIIRVTVLVNQGIIAVLLLWNGWRRCKLSNGQPGWQRTEDDGSFARGTWRYAVGRI